MWAEAEFPVFLMVSLKCTAPTLVQPESRAALLTCLGRQMGAHPPAADEAPAYPAGKTAGAPAQRCFGCPEPSTRRDHLPKQQ